MDEPDLEMRKGGIFTVDVIVGITVLFVVILLIVTLLPKGKGEVISDSYEIAGSIISTLKGMELSELEDNPKYPYANQLLQEGLGQNDETVLEIVAQLYVDGEEGKAWNLTRELLEYHIPEEFGIEVELEEEGIDCLGREGAWSCIYYSPRSAGRRMVVIHRHFIYFDNETKEMRILLYK